MPLTTLNKVVNLLIIGAFAMALTALHVALFMPSLVPEWLVHPKNWTPGVVAALVPVAVVLSVAIEAIAYLFRTRRKSFWEAESVSAHWVAAPDRHSFRQMESWRAFFEHEAERSRLAPTVEQDATGPQDARLKRQVLGGFAVGLVFQRENSITIDWVVQHYAMYRLEISTIVVLLLGCASNLLIAFLLPSARGLCLTVVVLVELVVAFLVFLRALQERAYVYEIVYRHAFLLLRQPTPPYGDGTIVTGKAEPAGKIGSARNSEVE